VEKQLNQVAAFHRKIGKTVSPLPKLLDHDADLDCDLARTLRQVIDSFNRQDNATDPTGVDGGRRIGRNGSKLTTKMT